MSSIAQQFAQAIQNAEGYGISGAIPTMSNNPGDLKLGDVGYGTTSGGITNYGSVESGAAALLTQAQKMLGLNGQSSNVYNQNMTLAQAGALYAGGDPNWAANVAKSMGVTTDATLGSISAQNGSVLNGLDGITSGTNSPLLYGQTGSGTGQQTTTSVWVARGAVIVTGLILIAAGVFSFKSTAVVIQRGAKIASKAAELVA